MMELEFSEKGIAFEKKDRKKILAEQGLKFSKKDLEELEEERKQILEERELFPERYVQWRKLHRKNRDKRAEQEDRLLALWVKVIFKL